MGERRWRGCLLERHESGERRWRGCLLERQSSNDRVRIKATTFIMLAIAYCVFHLCLKIFVFERGVEQEFAAFDGCFDIVHLIIEFLGIDCECIEIDGGRRDRCGLLCVLCGECLEEVVVDENNRELVWDDADFCVEHDGGDLPCGIGINWELFCRAFVERVSRDIAVCDEHAVVVTEFLDERAELRDVVRIDELRVLYSDDDGDIGEPSGLFSAKDIDVVGILALRDHRVVEMLEDDGGKLLPRLRGEFAQLDGERLHGVEPELPGKVVKLRFELEDMACEEVFRERPHVWGDVREDGALSARDAQRIVRAHREDDALFIDCRAEAVRERVGDGGAPHGGRRMSEDLHDRRADIIMFVMLRVELFFELRELGFVREFLVPVDFRLVVDLEVFFELELDGFSELDIVIFKELERCGRGQHADIDRRELDRRDGLGQCGLICARKGLLAPTSEREFAGWKPYDGTGFAALCGTQQTCAHDDVGGMPDMPEELAADGELRDRLVIQRPLGGAQDLDGCFKKCHDKLSARQTCSESHRAGARHKRMNKGIRIAVLESGKL